MQTVVCSIFWIPTITIALYQFQFLSFVFKFCINGFASEEDEIMAKFQHPVQRGFSDKQVDTNEVGFVPYWARCQVQYAQNLLECSDEPIVYDHNDEDYQDNCFFFPEDCSWSPPKEWVVDNSFDTETETDTTSDSRGTYDETEEYEYYSDNGNMIPGLPDIKMLDAEALGDLLEDNLSPPEITSIMYGSILTSFN